jgi:hypothetical protein
MSRGFGKIQLKMFNVLKNGGKPMSYADIVDALLTSIGHEPGGKLNASRERSFRRALHSLVDAGALIVLDDMGRGVRYSLYPADLSAEWAANYRAALNGDFEAARAVAIAMVRRLKPDGDVPSGADVMGSAGQMLQAAFVYLAAEAK